MSEATRKFALDRLQKARNRVSKAEHYSGSHTIARAQIALDMILIGYDAVQRKIAAGHPYGTPGICLGSEVG